MKHLNSLGPDFYLESEKKFLDSPPDLDLHKLCMCSYLNTETMSEHTEYQECGTADKKAAIGNQHQFLIKPVHLHLQEFTNNLQTIHFFYSLPISEFLRFGASLLACRRN